MALNKCGLVQGGFVGAWSLLLVWQFREKMAFRADSGSFGLVGSIGWVELVGLGWSGWVGRVGWVRCVGQVVGWGRVAWVGLGRVESCGAARSVDRFC